MVSSVDSEPTFQSLSGAMAQVPAQPPSDLPPSTASISSSPPPSYVTEALLSRGNIFSIPVSSVKPVDAQALVSDKPFLAPVTRPAGYGCGSGTCGCL